jgi:putative zinc finger/helix-turn-helix YgiT family protein
MECHEVETVEVEEKTIFKGVEVDYLAIYDYCHDTDEFLSNEDFIRANGLAVKDAYRVKVGLLTSKEIKGIRDKYGISQKEFSEVLDWGQATITRYENHQVQDRAHDDILRKIDSDPQWFLEMLERAKDKIAPRYYAYYHQNATRELEKKIAQYIYNFSKINYHTLNSPISTESCGMVCSSELYDNTPNRKLAYGIKAAGVNSLNVAAA